MKVLTSMLCLGMCLLYAEPAISQADSLASHTLIVKFSPQHLLVNGYHFEVEKSLHSQRRHSLVFSPRLYFGNTATVDSFNDRDHILDEKNRVKGYGMALQHRIYIDEYYSTILQGMYMAYGIEYSHFRLSFEREGYIKEVNEEGLEYYKFRQRPFSEQIDRIGVVGMGGLQIPIFYERLVADISFGIGYRESYTSTDYSEALFNVGTTDFGYTGMYVLGNLKFGFMF